jgi:phosphoribosylaminoimidazole-succinocarboxamide synthase
VAKRLKPIMVEAVVRGYIIGSGWKDYQDTGAICGIQLPGRPEQAASKLPQPISPRPPRPTWASMTKTSASLKPKRIGTELAHKIRDVAIQLYTEAAEYAATRGIIADTKFEFGLDDNGVCT